MPADPLVTSLLPSSSSEAILVPWMGLLVSLSTLVVCRGTSNWLHASRLTLPASATQDKELTWRWINVLISLVHSFVSGLWSVYW